ncbi:MAG TPA: MBL fold metallo-hydrolase [Balneolales bacterium]|nr:MBL fold metallo-hydrolase [Balneolales bacterium]
MIEVLDLHFFKDHTIASFLVKTSEGPVLIETGPDTVWDNLKKSLKEHGYEPSDVRNVLLTHIHFDHAGGAWHLAREGATIHVHSKGASHMASPEKLWQSAKRIYGDDMDRLWGKMEPIPEKQIHIVEDSDRLEFGDVEIEAHYTPGHAQHHLAYRLEDVVFTGDVGGVRIGGKSVVPPCPPPDINVELWKESIKRLREINPNTLYPTHFGCYQNVGEHLDQLEANLRLYAGEIKSYLQKGYDQEEMLSRFKIFVREHLIEDGLDEDELEQYEIANPVYMSVTGLARYWKKFHPETISS